MTNLSTLRAELAEKNLDVLAPQAAFMVKGGSSSHYSNGSKKNKSNKKSNKKNSKGNGGYGGGWGCGCGC
jgi:hypothetical protein